MFKIGDIVRCKRIIHFLDNTIHVPGKDYEITQETIAYFLVMSKDYFLINK
jgi:hypothetical protein